MRKYADCERAVQDTVARFGRLDILVNCAAGNFLATAEELSSNGFRTGASCEVTNVLEHRCVLQARAQQQGSDDGAGRQQGLVRSTVQRLRSLDVFDDRLLGRYHAQKSDELSHVPQ